MADPQVIDEWLRKADEDYGFASLCLADLEEGFFAQICFHFQQAAEKYLKAYIMAHDLRFQKIHDLTTLLSTCCQHDASLETLRTACEFLTDFYVETRYPVHWPSAIDAAETAQARVACERIHQAIRAALGK